MISDVPKALPRRVEFTRTGALESWLYGAFIVSLAMTPFWLGGNRLIAWGLHAILFSVIVIALEMSLLLSRERHPVGLYYLRTPVLLVGSAVLWMIIQASGIVPDSWKHPIWAIASGALGETIPGSISVNRELTVIALVRLFTAFAVFWVSLQLCRNAGRANRMLFHFTIIGCIYAAYGIFALALAPNTILWFEKTDYVGYVTATFINRNSFASFAGVMLIAAIGVTIRLFRRKVDTIGAGWRLQLSKAIEATGRQGVFLLMMIFTLVLALLLSGSRAGITSTALGIFVLVILVIAREERRRSGQIGTILTACAVIIGVFLAYGDVFVGRLDSLAEDAGGRVAAYRITVASIRDAPILGFGYGTFQDVFPMYRDGSVGLWGSWDKAHNTYLEIFQGLGLLFGGAYLAGIGFLLWRCVQASLLRHRTSTVPIVVVSASVLLGVHAMVDFSLQIQAITLIWSALLGAGVAQSWSSRKELDVI